MSCAMKGKTGMDSDLCYSWITERVRMDKLFSSQKGVIEESKGNGSDRDGNKRSRE